MYIISKQWLTVNEYFKWLQKAEVISLFQLPNARLPGVFIIQNLGKQALKLQKRSFDNIFETFLWETSSVKWQTESFR